MDAVRAFNNELSSLYEGKPPISRAKMAQITKSAIKAIKFYKHVVQSVEKFIQKCRQEYKIPGLYVIDSIVRQSRHQFGPDKEVFGPRFMKNIVVTFQQLYKCTLDEKSKIIRVLNLWQKNDVFPASIVQPLIDLAEDPSSFDLINKVQQAAESISGHKVSRGTDDVEKMEESEEAGPQQGDVTRLLSQLLQQSQQPQLQLSQSAQQQQMQQLHMLQQQLLQQARILQDPQPQLSIMDMGLLQQIQSLMEQLVTMKTRSDDTQPSSQPAFNKKLLDFDYGESDDEDGDKHLTTSSPPSAHFTLLPGNQSFFEPDVSEDHLPTRSVFKTDDHLPYHASLKTEEGDECRLNQSAYKTESNPPVYKTEDRNRAYYHGDVEIGQVMHSADRGTMHADDMFAMGRGQHDKQRRNYQHEVEYEQFMISNERGPHTGTGAPYFPEQSQQLARARQGSPRRPLRSRSRSPVRDSRQDRDRGRRSRSRTRRKRLHSRSSSRERDVERQKKERERVRHAQGLPPVRDKHAAVCSTTLWIGHLKPSISEDGLTRELEKYGRILSVNLIPPRGCAFVCFASRPDAHVALANLRGTRLMGSILKAAWAPGKGVKESQFKDNWDVDLGVTYIAWDDLPADLEQLLEGSILDDESLSEPLRKKREQLKEASGGESSAMQSANEVNTSPLTPHLPAGTAIGMLPGMMMMPPPGMNASLPPPPLGMPPPVSMMPPFGPPYSQIPLPPSMVPLPQPPLPLVPSQPSSHTSASVVKDNSQLAEAIQNIFSNSATILAVAQNKSTSADSLSESVRPLTQPLPAGYVPAAYNPSMPPPLRKAEADVSATVVEGLSPNGEPAFHSDMASKFDTSAPVFMGSMGAPIHRPAFPPKFESADWRGPRGLMFGPRLGGSELRSMRPSFELRPDGLRLYRPQLGHEADMRVTRAHLPPLEVEAMLDKNIVEQEHGLASRSMSIEHDSDVGMDYVNISTARLHGGIRNTLRPNSPNHEFDNDRWLDQETPRMPFGAHMQYVPFNRMPFNRMRMPHERFPPPGAFRPRLRGQWPDGGMNRPRWQSRDSWEQDRRGRSDGDRQWQRDGFREDRGRGKEGQRNDRIKGGDDDVGRMDRSHNRSEQNHRQQVGEINNDELQNKRANDNNSHYSDDSVSSNRDHKLEAQHLLIARKEVVQNDDQKNETN